MGKVVEDAADLPKAPGISASHLGQYDRAGVGRSTGPVAGTFRMLRELGS